MSQSSFSIPNESFPSTRSDMNAAFQALASASSGASAPSTTYAYQWWADTTNGVLKQRDSTNASWQIRASLSAAMTPAKTASFSVALADIGKTFMVSAASGAVTATLLAAATAGAGFYFTMKRTDSTVANAVTIDGNASETIDGALTMLLSNQYDTVTLVSDGTNWYRINDRPFTMTQAEVTLASATTTDLGSVNTNMVAISGTTTITGLGSSASILNPVYHARFTGALTLTHNATSLILPGSANITTAAGDAGIFEYLGSGNWRCLSYQKISGLSVAGAGITLLAKRTPGAVTTDQLTGIPTGVKRVTINFLGLSKAGTGDWAVQIGPSGGVITSGYVGTSRGTTSTTSIGGGTSWSALGPVVGSLILSLAEVSSNTWSWAGVPSGSGFNIDTGGYVPLSGALERILITDSGGSPGNFSAGSWQVSYE